MSTPPLLDIVQLADGDSHVFEIFRGIRLTVIPGAGATVSYSKVDSHNATAHDTGTKVDVTDATTIDADWPFYFVSTASGSARAALV